MSSIITKIANASTNKINIKFAHTEHFVGLLSKCVFLPIHAGGQYTTMLA